MVVMRVGGVERVKSSKLDGVGGTDDGRRRVGVVADNT